MSGFGEKVRTWCDCFASKLRDSDLSGENIMAQELRGEHKLEIALDASGINGGTWAHLSHIVRPPLHNTLAYQLSDNGIKTPLVP